MTKACIAAALALVALSGHAADKKEWLKLEGCRYVTSKSNDGDSFLVQCGEQRFYARLYFVDCPEADVSFPDRVRQQYDYFGVSQEEVTRTGARARNFVSAALGQKPFVIQTRKAFAQGRSKNTRYFSLVQVDGRYLHEILLSEGLARNKGTIVGLPDGEKAKTHVAKLRAIEDRARLERKGVWATSDPAKRILNSPM